MSDSVTSIENGTLSPPAKRVAGIFLKIAIALLGLGLGAFVGLVLAAFLGLLDIGC